jgi:predicted enzyme related to lactoylglutathione lyase
LARPAGAARLGFTDRKEAPVPERTKHAPGSWCWPEIAAADPATARGFYGELLGWEFREMPGGGYAVAHRKGRAVAGLRAATPDPRTGKPSPRWLSYARVSSADASAGKAASLGGKVLAAPFDVPGVGRMAVIEDPTGACFAVWEPKGMEGVGLVDEPGAPCWYELMTRDAEKARSFYTGLFGWTVKVSPIPTSAGVPYFEFLNGGAMACGMMEMKGPAWGDLPSHWMPYVAVEDADAVAKRCGELGGRTVHGPADIPGVGRFAVLAAPDGAAFSVIRLG